MNRESFEKIPKIAQLIEEGEGDNLIFVPETNKYDAEMYITFTPDYVHYLNGAWMMYQNQQKKIEEVLQQLDTLQEQYWSKWKENADMMKQGASVAYENSYWLLKEALE